MLLTRLHVRVQITTTIWVPHGNTSSIVGGLSGKLADAFSKALAQAASTPSAGPSARPAKSARSVMRDDDDSAGGGGDDDGGGEGDGYEGDRDDDGDDGMGVASKRRRRSTPEYRQKLKTIRSLVDGHNMGAEWFDRDTALQLAYEGADGSIIVVIPGSAITCFRQDLALITNTQTNVRQCKSHASSIEVHCRCARSGSGKRKDARMGASNAFLTPWYDEEADATVNKKRKHYDSIECNCGYRYMMYVGPCPECSLAVIAFPFGVAAAAHDNHDPSMSPEDVFRRRSAWDLAQFNKLESSFKPDCKHFPPSPAAVAAVRSIAKIRSLTASQSAVMANRASYYQKYVWTARLFTRDSTTISLRPPFIAASSNPRAGAVPRQGKDQSLRDECRTDYEATSAAALSVDPHYATHPVTQAMHSVYQGGSTLPTGANSGNAADAAEAQRRRDLVNTHIVLPRDVIYLASCVTAASINDAAVHMRCVEEGVGSLLRDGQLSRDDVLDHIGATRSEFLQFDAAAGEDDDEDEEGDDGGSDDDETDSKKSDDNSPMGATAASASPFAAGWRCVSCDYNRTVDVIKRTVNSSGELRQSVISLEARRQLGFSVTASPFAWELSPQTVSKMAQTYKGRTDFGKMSRADRTHAELYKFASQGSVKYMK